MGDRATGEKYAVSLKYFYESGLSIGASLN